MSNQKKLNFCQLTSAKVFLQKDLDMDRVLLISETAAMEASDTQSEDDWFSVGSEGSESEDELLLEFGDANNSDENDLKDSESEEEDELSEGDR